MIDQKDGWSMAQESSIWCGLFDRYRFKVFFFSWIVSYPTQIRWPDQNKTHLGDTSITTTTSDHDHHQGCIHNLDTSASATLPTATSPIATTTTDGNRPIQKKRRVCGGCNQICETLTSPAATSPVSPAGVSIPRKIIPHLALGPPGTELKITVITSAKIKITSIKITRRARNLNNTTFKTTKITHVHSSTPTWHFKSKNESNIYQIDFTKYWWWWHHTNSSYYVIMIQ